MTQGERDRVLLASFWKGLILQSHSLLTLELSHVIEEVKVSWYGQVRCTSNRFPKGTQGQQSPILSDGDFMFLK